MGFEIQLELKHANDYRLTTYDLMKMNICENKVAYDEQRCTELGFPVLSETWRADLHLSVKLGVIESWRLGHVPGQLSPGTQRIWLLLYREKQE